MDSGGNFERVEIVEEVLGQCLVFGDAFKALFPAWEGTEMGFDFYLVEFEGDFVGGVAVDVVVGAHLDFFEVVHDVGLGDEEIGNAVEHAGVAERGDVNPATAARTARGGTVFVTDVAEELPSLVEELGGEGTGTYTSAVGLADAHDATDARGGDTQT